MVMLGRILRMGVAVHTGLGFAGMRRILSVLDQQVRGGSGRGAGRKHRDHPHGDCGPQEARHRAILLWKVPSHKVIGTFVVSLTVCC